MIHVKSFRILTVIMALAVLFGAVSALSASAVDITEYDLWIAGVRVTSENDDGITGEGISGSVTFNYSTKTLTLENATINSNAAYTDYDYAIRSGMNSVTIAFKGTNTVTVQDTDNDYAFAMFFEGTSEIIGAQDSVLNVHSGKAKHISTGIQTNRRLILTGGTLNTTASDAEEVSMGINCDYSDLYVNGCTVNATGEKAELSRGIGAYDFVVDSGVINAVSGESTHESIAIYSTVTAVRDSTVIATADKAPSSYGMFSVNDTQIKRCFVYAVGGEATFESCGIGSTMHMTIEGGMIYAVGGQAGDLSVGIYSDYNITVTAGDIYATGNDIAFFAEEDGNSIAGTVSQNGSLTASASNGLVPIEFKEAPELSGYAFFVNSEVAKTVALGDIHYDHKYKAGAATAVNDGFFSKPYVCYCRLGYNILVETKKDRIDATDIGAIDAKLEKNFTADYIDITVTDIINSAVLDKGVMVFEIAADFDFNGKLNFDLYRNVNGVVNKLTALSDKPTTFADGTYYADMVNGKIYIYTDKTATYAAAYHTHVLKNIAEKAPTNDADSNIEYWYCEGCDKYFKDKDGKEEIEKGATILKYTAEIPDTGDTRNVDTWAVVFFVSSVAAAATLMLKKRGTAEV